MIISQKCNCCMHEKICGFKSEYQSACEEISRMYYANGDSAKALKTSDIDVSIKCPYIMTKSAVRGVKE